MEKEPSLVEHESPHDLNISCDFSAIAVNTMIVRIRKHVIVPQMTHHPEKLLSALFLAMTLNAERNKNYKH